MTETAAVPRPDHVPADRVVDFNFYADARYAPDNLHAGIARLMEEAPPVFWTPRNGGHWVIAGYPELFEALRNTEVFSSAKLGIPSPSREMRLPPISYDPPEHAKYREPLSRAFSPKAMLALKDDIRALAAELIDPLVATGGCEFALDLAEQLPVIIFMKMMGLPLAQLAEFRSLVNTVMTQSDPQVRGAAILSINEAMAEIIRQRTVRRENDLVSTLLDTQIEGRAITHEEMMGYCQLLFLAGLDTVMNAMCFGALHLARNPDLQERLRARPQDIVNAVEEFLRLYSPVQVGRVITRDHDAFGVHFKAGERVLNLLAGSGIDAREFDDPLTFSLERTNRNHLAFNAGPHRCAGSHLARIELCVLYEEMLERLPPFQLDPASPPKLHGGHVLGFDSLRLVWDAP